MMEKRKESLNLVRMCRFCLTQNETLESLYDRNLSEKNSPDLHLKILSCVSIEIFPSDKMPSFICQRCKLFMSLFYEYKKIVRQADETILQYIQHNYPMEIITWPSILSKVYHKMNEIDIVKTLEGATMQVSSHENSDSDEEDGNIYNIKIEDGPDNDTKTACVKIISSKESKDMEVPLVTGFASVSKLARHVRTHAGERPYPCKLCDKSFAKSHHYTRHLRQTHRENKRSVRGPYGGNEQYRCDQCEDTFTTQDALIYHSAIHATQNLTCPLCQEKFEDVDAVTVHIKSHVNGTEFMCDFCELVFTSKEKLDTHQATVHEEEMQCETTCIDESSIEMECDEDEDDNAINVKEEGDHMIIEIKKADEFLVSNTKEDSEEKPEITNSEESESDTILTELATVEPVSAVKTPIKIVEEKVPPSLPQPSSQPLQQSLPSTSLSTIPTSSSKPVVQKKNATSASKVNDGQTASILRRAEEIKRKVILSTESLEIIHTNAVIEKKNVAEEKPVIKVETANSGGASDKSLRLLEKELQDLKRTNSRTEVIKAPIKIIDTVRNKRLQLHTSTPKIKTIEERKLPVVNKSPALEKKIEKRIITKENKEPKEVKEAKSSNSTVKEEKDKEKETPKSVIKNGSGSDKSTFEEIVRRSTRPSKIKNYAKMIRVRSQMDSEEETTSEDDDEYTEFDTSIETRTKGRRISQTKVPSVKSPVATPSSTTPAPRKRGRPRKEPPKEVPIKIRKEDNEDVVETQIEKTKSTIQESSSLEKNTIKSASEEKHTTPDVLVSPTGQTLKKVPVKALPPGVKPLPLPMNARPLGTAELCEMQIGKKMVKVQKIVMTKAEVEAMAKKGLVEMKDGTMVLKQGIKLPTADPLTIKSSLFGPDLTKESLSQKDKAAPSRCDFGEESQ